MGNNTQATTAAADFALRLHTERDALKAFVTLLETEQQALIDGHAEQLFALADSKVLATQELSNLATARSDKLLAHGVKPGGMTAWLQANAKDSLPVWHDIQQLAEQSQQLNRTNGVLIQTKLRNNQQALMVLQNAAHGTPGLYGPDGQPNLSASGRTLGSV